ncbi:uncharacterized protein LOC106472807 isoform X2 [Limulus polyphemus]|uniref:Uncharacterized protein LOC106472807 isoform X2 n=1 Tax=Limulus polyphemus TaxID=6850 RepID=A0ABM1BUI7_LIMPO|nr:uncharacterized protein LOC106472807 isoform X2 [Limulus polyphemus]
MKHPWRLSSDSPASVQNWLESRGTDGVYSSCILGLFKLDSFELDGPECENNTLKHQQNLEQIGTENQYILPASKARHKRLKGCERGLSKKNTAVSTSNSSIKIEDRKKSVAEECLKSACEQKSSIEPLGVNESAEILNSLEVKREEIICESEQKPSSLEVQTQFSAIFSSLSGKPEPPTKLCPQQERENSSKCVGNDHRIIQHDYQTAIHNLQQSILNMEEGYKKIKKQGDRARDEDKESQCQKIFNKGKEITGSKTVKEEANVTGDLETWKPSFVVPKMKPSCSRVPFTIKHSPFNVLSNIQGNLSLHLESHVASETMTNNLEKKSKEDDCQKVASSEADDLFILEDKENIQMLDSEQVDKIFLRTTPKTLSHDPFTWEHWKFALGPGEFLSEESLDEKLVDNLVNKFNESVAAIWGKTDDLPSNENLDLKTNPQQVEFSLKMLTSMLTNSGKLQTPNYTENKNVNPVQGYSVWSAGYDDLKTLSLNESNFSPFALTSLRRNLAAGIISGFLASGIGLGKTTRYSEDHQSPAFSEHIQYLQKGSFVPDEDEVNIQEDNKDLDDILSFHPDAICSSLEDDDGILMSSSEDDSRQESPVINFVGSKVHLWKDTPEHVTEPVENSDGDCWLPFLSTHNTFGVFCNSHKGENETENKFSFGNVTEQSVDCKKNDDCHELQDFRYCTTLTYHKGESKFVEVVPSSYKKKNLEDDRVGNYYNEAYRSFSKYEVNVEEEENLLTSPRTHFQPIREDSFDSENSDDTEIVTLTVKQDEESPEFLVDLTSVDEIRVSQSPGSGDFDKLENNEKLKENGRTQRNRRRKRTVSSSCEELVSLTGAFNLDETGSGSSSLTEEEEESQVSGSFSRTNDLYEDKGTNTETGNYYGLWEDEKLQDDGDYSLASGGNSLFNVYEEEQWNFTDVPWKWSTNDHEKTTWIFEITEAPHDSKVLPVSDKDVVSEKTDLSLLREEIEAEEEELLRDITRVKDRWEDVIELKEQNDFQDYSSVGGLENKTNEICCEEDCASVYTPFDGFYSNLGENYQDLAQYWDMGNMDYKTKELNAMDLQDLNDTPYPSATFLPRESVFFSSQLEEEWRRDSSPFGVQIPRRKKPKSRVLSQKRPCTFYLEGNCLRKDCRFSHDLSQITCRFWEESSCFKGVTCPFLHGYPSPAEHNFERENSTKRSFLLESENDFPSLSKSVENHLKILEGNKSLRMGRKRGKQEQKYPVED